MEAFLLKSVELHGAKRPDGTVETYDRELGIFDSVKAAESMIAAVVAKEKSYTRFFAFYLVEKTVTGGFTGPFKQICQWQTIRSYFPDGKLNCCGKCDEACMKEFTGREARTIRYKVGELVWVRQHGQIAPMIIGALPMTKTEYRSRKAKWKDAKIAYSGGDYSDDCYMAYSYGDHRHPQCWDVFPYTGTISKRNFKQLESCRKWHEHGRKV